MRKMIPVALVAVLATCSIDSTEPTTITEPGPETLRAEYSASMTATDGSGVAGSLALTDYTTYFEANVSVANGPANSELDWRIFPGPCSSEDDDEAGGSNQAYGLLTTNAAGAASLTRVMAAHLVRPGNVYNVRIMTDNDIEDTIACGPLQ